MAIIMNEGAIRRHVRDEIEKQFIKEHKQFFNTQNHRLARLNKFGYTPASSYAQRTGGTFTFRGKNSIEALQKEYRRALAFSKMETSTVKGARAWRRAAEQRAREVTGLSDDDAVRMVGGFFDMMKERPDIQAAMNMAGVTRNSHYLMEFIRDYFISTYGDEHSFANYNDMSDSERENIVNQLTEQYMTQLKEYAKLTERQFAAAIANELRKMS